MNRVCSRRYLNYHFLTRNIVDIHVMVIRVVNACDIPLAWTHAQSGDSLCRTSKTILANTLHSIRIPDMEGRFGSTFTCSNKVPTTLSLAHREICNVILMVRPISLVLFLSF